MSLEYMMSHQNIDCLEALFSVLSQIHILCTNPTKVLGVSENPLW